jgi:hypothetical protein
LRVLEYYAGILFLTTNRVGDFDEAFTSRIHVSLYYPELNLKKTVQVFDINMDIIEERFKRKGRRIKIERGLIVSFASQHFTEHAKARWNGRQIRNACQTALALAEYEAQGQSLEETPHPDAEVKLKVDHFEPVRKAYLEFTKYIDELFGNNAAERAKEWLLRSTWMEKNSRTVDMGGKGFDNTAFSAQGQQYWTHQQPSSMAQGLQQGPYQGFQQRYPRHPHYQDSTTMGSDNAQTRVPADQIPTNPNWTGPAMRGTGATVPTQGYSDDQELQQRQAAPSGNWVDPIPAASREQYTGQAQPNNLPPATGGYQPVATGSGYQRSG